MKKVLLTLILAVVGFSAMAQQVTGTFAPLKNQARVKMIVDYSEADIMGMPEEQFYTYEKDWAKDKIVALSQLYSAANEVLSKKAFSVGNYSFDTDYTLYIFVRSVDVKGNHDCDLVLVANDEVEVGRANGIRASGGRFGSKLNLMKDGMEHTGTAVGKFLLKQVKSGR
ncbi:MAG: hypothetical protein IJK74_07365 [Bacteroidales bacterium]|nr:hypothetical protein [Bacteroidales bacterium]